MNKTKRKNSGFTLTEVIIASMAFVFIFTGLAGIFQTGVVLTKASQGAGDCIRQYKDGMRLLWEGDNSPTNPQLGLATARRARIRDAGAGVWAGSLEYRTPGAITWNYRVLVATGTLIRMSLLPPLQTKVLMGDSSNRIVVFPNTNTANPMAVLVPGDDQPKTVVKFSLRLFHDFDGNLIVGGNEMECLFSSSIFLRNSEKP